MTESSPLPAVGVSACLLGEPVRWDGGERRAGVLLEVLGPHVRWVSVCPEVEAGLGVPREPVRLERALPGPRVRAVETGRDLTERMARHARERLAELEAEGLCGFLLQARSPSCGLAGVALHDEEGGVVGRQAGLFAAALLRTFPGLPVAEAEPLDDEAACEAFLAAVRAYARGRSDS